MATILDKELKRRIAVDGEEYTVVVDPKGMRLVGKGKRRPEVELRWSDLLSGDAALAVALNASVSVKQGGARRSTARPAAKTAEPAAKKRTR